MPRYQGAVSKHAAELLQSPLRDGLSLSETGRVPLAIHHCIRPKFVQFGDFSILENTNETQRASWMNRNRDMAADQVALPKCLNPFVPYAWETPHVGYITLGISFPESNLRLGEINIEPDG